jgi:hypothetical protein
MRACQGDVRALCLVVEVRFPDHDFNLFTRQIQKEPPMSLSEPPLSHWLRRPFGVIAALVAGASVLAAGLTPIASASAQPRPAVPPSAMFRKPGASPFSTSIEEALSRAAARARADNGPRAALSANPGAAKLGSFLISPAVHRFLTDDLGISLGGSDRLTGAVSNHYVVASGGAPTGIHFGLPSGVAAPVLAGAQLVSDTRSGSLTVALVSSAGTAASLDVVIPNASTANATGVSGTFEMPVVPVLGGDVAFRGPVSFANGAAVLSAAAYDPSATSINSQIHLEGGTHVTYRSTSGFAVTANGYLGNGSHTLPVSLAGTVRSASNWSLRATAASRSDVLMVTKGFEVEGGFSGTVADTDGSVTFDVSSNGPVAWTPLATTSQMVEHIEYSDRTAPASAVPVGTSVGSPWVLAEGRFAVSAGTSGTLEATGAIGFDLSSHRAALVSSSTGGLMVRSGAQSFALRDVTLGGDLVVGPQHLEGTLSGQGSVLGGGPTATTADLTLTSTGALLASFSNGAAHTTWSSVVRPAAPSAIPTAPIPAAGTGHAAQSAGAGTYTVSAAVLAYLTTTLGIPLGISTTLSGQLAGTTLTITAGAPAEVKPVLPTGAAALSFASSTIVINESTNQLSVTASASAAGGESATLAVAIPSANTSNVTGASGIAATIGIDGLQVFGTPVNLSGSVALNGTPPAFSLTGVIAAGTSVTSAAAFASGMLTLSSKGALSVAGIVTIGSGPTAINVAVSGSLTSFSKWSLSVTDSDAPSWQPISNLVVQPDFTGSIAAKAGRITVSLKSPTGASPVTWLPGANTSISVSGLTISNATPPRTVTCNALSDGGIWIGVTGTIDYSVFGASAVSLPGEACIVLGSTVYTTTTTPTGTLNFDGSLFSIGKLQLIVSGDTASSNFSVTGTAQLKVGSVGPFTLAANFSATGAFIAAVSLPSLSTLGVKGLTGTGVVWLSSKDLPTFVGEPGLPTVAEFHLRVGLSVTFTYPVPAKDVTSLRSWGIPIPSTVQAVASLSPDGFTVEFDLGFGNPGFELFSSDPNNSSDPNAATAFLNDLNFAITLSADPTIEVDGVVTLNLPAITGDSYSQATSIQLTLSATISLVSANVSLGLSITGNCGGQACPWTNAFGIPDLTIGVFGATVGITFDSGIPTPTFGFSLDGVILPQAIAGPIGLQAGASISIDINFDLTAPVINLQLASGSPGTPALLPLEITGIPTVQNAIVIDDAGLFIAPIGGNLANGMTVAPGIAVNFDAVIGGLPVNVDALDSPFTLTVSALISVPAFNIGPITIGGPGEPGVYLNLSISPAGFIFEFEGAFTSAGFSFSANLSLSAVNTFAGASFSLSLTAGLPSWLQVSGSLSGSVSIDGSGNFQASASGDGWLIIGGAYIGEVSFNYSFAYGFLWQSITAAAQAVAQAFENAYGWADQTVTYYLNQLEYQAGAIAAGLQAAFASISPSQIASDLNQFVTSSSQAVASALESVGYTFDQIGAAIENVYGEAQQALQNTLTAIGADAWDVLNALNSVFTSGWDGTYYLSITPQGGGVQGAPLFMDVSGGSYSPGAQVIDYPWDGGANQHWYFESLGDGLAYIVNENSGQCLTVPGSDSTPGAPIQQWPCDGQAEEMWQMDVVQQNLLGPSMYIVNAYDGLVVDGAGASWFSANLDQWPINYNWNQEWTVSPGLF